jgi:hypothetical protein
LRIFRQAGAAAGAAAALLMVTGCFERPLTQPPPGKPVSADDFRRDLVDVPLCGTPASGPVAGKAMCTIHFADGSATLAGSGVVARGFWQFEGDAVCRRDERDPVEQERCVRYERLANGRYRNSDGVVICIGPCADRR